ncbi:copia protein [Tanacetum coccineum]
MRKDDGVFLFKFASKTGVEQVLERGPWMIRKSPIMLTKWSLSLSFKKGKVTSVPIWVKLHGVPLLAYFEDGLSLIATQIGKPLLLDAFTSSMCVESWGQISFAHALAEYNTSGSHLIVLSVNFLDMVLFNVQNVLHEADSSTPFVATTNSTSVEDHEEGFIEFKGRKNKGKKADAKSRPIGGVRLNKPKSSFYRVKPVVATDQAETFSSESSEHKESFPSRVKSDTRTTPMSNSFDVLNKLVEKDDVKCQAKGNAKKDNVASSSNPASSPRGFEFGEFGESKEDELFEPDDGMTSYMSSTGGGQQLEDDDLDFSNGYEAQVDDLPGQMDALYDHFDIRFKSRVCLSYVECRFGALDACICLSTSRAVLENGTKEGLGDSSNDTPIAFPHDMQMDIEQENVCNRSMGVTLK